MRSPPCRLYRCDTSAPRRAPAAFPAWDDHTGSPPHGDERGLRSRAGAERARIRRLRPVMRRHIHARAQPLGVLEQSSEGIVDGVAGEQRGERAALDPENERRCVDEKIVSRSEHGDRRAAELHALTSADRSAFDAALRERGGPEIGERARVEADRFDREANVVALEDREQPRAVIGVRVREATTSMRRCHGGSIAPSSSRTRAGSGPPSMSASAPPTSTRYASPCPTSSAITRADAALAGHATTVSEPATTMSRAAKRAPRGSVTRGRDERSDRARRMTACSACGDAARRTARTRPTSSSATKPPVIAPAGTVNEARGTAANVSTPVRSANAEAHASKAIGRAASSHSAPITLVAAPASISNGKLGTHTRFASGEMSDSRPKAPAMTGSVGAVAAIVVDRPSRSGDGRAGGARTRALARAPARPSRARRAEGRGRRPPSDPRRASQ